MESSISTLNPYPPKTLNSNLCKMDFSSNMNLNAEVLKTCKD